MQRKFTSEQEEIIHSWGTGMAVLAGAGSGKTTTLVAKCVRLLELNPKSRFAAVSFTERSANDLKTKLAEAFFQRRENSALNSDLSPSIQKSFGLQWITTIHGLCGLIIREYPREAGFEGEETVLTEAEAHLYWERALESLWMDEIPDEVRESLEYLLNRESRDSLADLVNRVRELASLGIFQFLESSEDPGQSALNQVAKYTIEKYQRLKRRQGYLDFSDLERGAARALESPAVAAAYHSRFSLVLVDEFQDTNPLQAGLIRRLAKPDASNLCVVGDPKQSIYRFRDADVTVFEEFCRQLPLQKSLTWNFRSVPGILEFANSVCEGAFQASGMHFDALTPKRTPVKRASTENALCEQISPEHLLKSGQNSKDEVDGEEFPVVKLMVQSPHELGQWLAGELRRGARLGDFALLLRKIRGNEKWLKGLNAAGIPIAVGSGGLFWEDPRVRELVAFLKWWDHPANSLSGATFLRAPWVNVPDLLLDQWIQVDPTLRRPFLESSHPLALALQDYVNRIVRPGELLLALLNHEEIEEELGAPILGLWHRVEELSSRGLDFHAVVSELSRSVQEKRREREVPAPRDLGQLTVLTLHGAKGLEFPYVILVDFTSKRRASDSPLLYWDRNLGAYLGARLDNGSRDTTQNLEKSWREIERKKNLAESKRLFYVAVTRAKDRLILVCPNPDLKLESAGRDRGRSEKSSLADPSRYLEDDWLSWIENSGIPVVPAIQPSAQYEGSQEGLLQKQPSRVCVSSQARAHSQVQVVSQVPANSLMKKRPRHSVTEWNLLARCPRAYEWSYVRFEKVQPAAVEVAGEEGEEREAGEAREAREVGEGGGNSSREQLQELGNQVHACLAKGDFDGLKALEVVAEGADFCATPLIKWAKTSPWMRPADLNCGRDVWAELPFEVPIGDEVLVGSIDRVIAERDQFGVRYSLIDFKVTEKIKSVDLLLEAYQTQIELYATAIQILEGGVSFEQIDARLVNITKSGVQIISVPLETAFQVQRLPKLVDRANHILNGASGEPKAGPLCRFCEFRSYCVEGVKFS